MDITVFDWIEDFDNDELVGDDWKNQILDAIRSYNYLYKVNYDPHRTFLEYCKRKQIKHDKDR